MPAIPLLLGLVLGLCFGPAATGRQLPQAVPDGPFKTVHLLAVAPNQEEALKLAVAHYNEVFAAQGCPACAYHLFKMYIGNEEQYNYLMTSDWPGGDLYLKIHTSAAYNAVTKRDPIMADLEGAEIYGRFIEVR
jgi:hypothetical protein